MAVEHTPLDVPLPFINHYANFKTCTILAQQVLNGKGFLKRLSNIAGEEGFSSHFKLIFFDVSVSYR